MEHIQRGSTIAFRQCSHKPDIVSQMALLQFIERVQSTPNELSWDELMDRREFLDGVDEEAKPTYFCSEYAAICLKKLKILPERLNTSRIVPGNYSGIYSFVFFFTSCYFSTSCSCDLQLRLFTLGMFGENGFLDKLFINEISYGPAVTIYINRLLDKDKEVTAEVTNLSTCNSINKTKCFADGSRDGRNRLLYLDPSISSKDRSEASIALHDCMERNLDIIFPRKTKQLGLQLAGHSRDEISKCTVLYF
jgi:hypothetical protein